MAGKITPFRSITPEDVTPRQVVSYETSTLFGPPTMERYNPDELATRKGLRIYSKMMDDEQVKAVVRFRLASITARGFEFRYEQDSPLAPAEREQRIKFYEHCVCQLRGSFHDALHGMLRGHQYGFSMTEKVYDTIEYDGKEKLGIGALLPRDPAWFRFFADKYGTLKKVEQCIGSERIEVDLGKFVHYVRAPEEDRFYGQSDLKAAYRAWYIKDVVIKLYTIYLERFAGGFAYAELAVEGNSITEGTTEYEALKTALSNMRNLASLILPPGVKLTVLQPGSTAEYREALTYFDLAIAKAVLVPNLLGLSHTGQTGAFSQSQTQLEAYFMTTAADTERLEDAVNEQLFKDLGDLNYGDGQYPRFCFKPASAEHVKWMIDTFKGLVGANAIQATEADETHLRKMLDLPARGEDDVLQKEAQLELDERRMAAEAKHAPKPTVGSFPFTRADLDALLRERDERLLFAVKEVVNFHTPGGHEHDQQRHAGGRKARVDELQGRGNVSRGQATREDVLYIAEKNGIENVEVRSVSHRPDRMIDGQRVSVLGTYNPKTDTITLNESALKNMNARDIRGILLHENTHRLFHKAGGFDEKGKVPSFLRENFLKLQDEDGTTAYAKTFWKGGKLNYGEEWLKLTAVNESLAEMRRMGKFKPTYSELYDLIGGKT